MTTRIFMIDTRLLVRLGFATLMGATRDFEIVGEASSMTEALPGLKSLHPHIVLVEWPPADGSLETGQEVGCPWLALSKDERISFLFLAVRAGAVGFIDESMTSEALIEAVRAVARGQNLWSAEQKQQAWSWEQGVYRKWASLSERERGMLFWLAQGMTQKAIAGKLHVSRRTVESHVCGLLRKLDLTTRNEAVAWTMKTGLWPLIERDQGKYRG